MIQIKLLTRDIKLDGNKITARITSGTNYLYTNKPDEMLINKYLVKVKNISCIKNRLYEITITGIYCLNPESTAAASVE